MNFKVFLIFVFTFLYSSTDSYSQPEYKVDSFAYKKFLPNYVKLQFAGGIGFLSTGVGYTFFDRKLDLTFFYGYIPKYVTADDLHSVSLQLTVKLLKYKILKNVEILPLNFGFFGHHTFGNEFWVKLPNNYPDNYYWWAPGRSIGVFIGGEIKTKLLANKTPASGTAFYTRIGTRSLYLVSKFSNSSISLNDIVELGFGVAVYR
ncbi:MAG: hypothetical protein PF487_03275 [Bacteroidales bacterium]|jgi:hypothetical protein|nr:hypothetical protein [Bacteroidales bacterium]